MLFAAKGFLARTIAALGAPAVGRLDRLRIKDCGVG
jgi:hypothetical protein